MTNGLIFKLGLAVTSVGIPSLAMAQSAGEILGQPIQATTNGVTNTIYFDPGGSLRILTAGGNAMAGTWQMSGAQLCMNLGGQQECVPYDRPFVAGEARNLVTTCNASTVWTAQAVNPAPAQGGR